ncbi:hypothetical protein ACH429_09545 [Streptomyces pathocidini]|uniref:DUF7144 domain-containing protein n=1 Tax=Streptomyces pathocidini TaxID=1650571 RepID=A0ABW7US60_9ACTN|nr:hypothetical protein [Streptomyces pathocidini]
MSQSATTTQNPRNPDRHQGLANGGTTFAGVLLAVTGLLSIFRGIMGIAKNDVFVATKDYVFRWDLTGWGWMHLILGLLVFLVGLALLKAAPAWARTAGVVLASLALIVNFLSLPWHPLWSLILVALYAFIIWALCTVKRGHT